MSKHISHDKKKVPFGRFLVLLLVLSATVFFFTQHPFRIAQTSCHIDDQSCPPDIQKNWNSLQGKSLFFADTNRVTQLILKENPSLSHPQFQKKITGEINVEFKQLSAAYQLHQNDQFYSIDPLGNCIQVTSIKMSLPVIDVAANVLQNLGVHQRLDSSTHTHFLAMITFLEEHPFPYTKIVLDTPSDIHIELSDGKIAQLRTDQAEIDVQKLGYVLANVDFAHLKQSIKSIDVRFKYPILKS